MKRELIDATLIALAIMTATCLVSLMVVFMGGGQEGADLRALMLAQMAAVPIALVIAVVCLSFFVAANGWRNGCRLLWQAVPQWMLFIFLLFNSLFGLGELSLFVVKQATDQVQSWHEHVPLVCMLFCSLAFLFLYAKSRSYPGSKPAMSGRWP